MLRGKKVTLRALEYKDAELLRGWRNHPELMPYHLSTLPVSEMEEKQFIEGLKPGGLIIFIIENEQNEPVGYTLIQPPDHKNRKAEVGLHLDPVQQGKGYGKDAFLTLIRFCFHELNLHRVYLTVFAFNERAIRIYEKMGFKHEGRMREAFFTMNAYQDILMMSLLEGEFVDG